MENILESGIIFELIIVLFSLVSDLKDLRDNLCVNLALGVELVEEFDGVIDKLLVNGVLVVVRLCCSDVGGGMASA